MKNGKKPTVKQCNIISENGLNPKEWLVVKHTSTEIVLIRRNGGEMKTFEV